MLHACGWHTLCHAFGGGRIGGCTTLEAAAARCEIGLSSGRAPERVGKFRRKCTKSGPDVAGRNNGEKERGPTRGQPEVREPTAPKSEPI